MAVEIVHFLMGKFADGLQGEDDAGMLFDKRFRELKWELEKKISSAMSLDTTNLLRELLYDLNDILIECRKLSRRRSDWRRRRGECIRGSALRELWFCYRTKKRLLAIMQRIQTISNERGGVAAIDISVAAEETGRAKAMELDRWTAPAVDMARIHGLGEQAREVERLLVEQGDRGFRAVGVAGMGGVGKTTLAQVVFNSAVVKQHFRPRLWVCMSQTCERGKDARKETVERMLMSLGVEEEVIHSAPADGMSGSRSRSLAVLTFMLHLHLLGKRYLIVFDDMWSTDKWYQGVEDCGSPQDGEWGDRLGYGLPKGDGGGVIVTGRIEAAVKGMAGGGDTHLLRPLDSRTACWSIFVDAYMNRGHAVVDDDDAALKAIEAEITDKCCGLPLAARTMAEIMSETMSSSSGTSSRSTSSNVSPGSSGSVE